MKLLKSDRLHARLHFKFILVCLLVDSSRNKRVSKRKHDTDCAQTVSKSRSLQAKLLLLPFTNHKPTSLTRVNPGAWSEVDPQLNSDGVITCCWLIRPVGCLNKCYRCEWNDGMMTSRGKSYPTATLSTPDLTLVALGVNPGHYVAMLAPDHLSDGWPSLITMWCSVKYWPRLCSCPCSSEPNSTFILYA